MKQEWRLQGKTRQGWICHPTAVALSVLPLGSSLRPLAWIGACLGWACWPTWIQGWRGASKARSRGRRGLHTLILHKSPDSPRARMTILQWMILHSLISLRVWGLRPGVFPQGCTFSSLFPLSPVQGGLLRPWSHTGASLPLSYGPLDRPLPCPGPPRALVGWPRRPQDGCSCLTRSPFPFVTEEAALELRFKDFSV